MLKWIIGGAAVALFGPTLLRKIADNPDALRKAADLTERGRDRAVEMGKRGASYAVQKTRDYRASRATAGMLASVMPGCH